MKTCRFVFTEGSFKSIFELAMSFCRPLRKWARRCLSKGRINRVQMRWQGSYLLAWATVSVLFVCFVSTRESRHVMKAFWKDRKFEIKPPLESDIVLTLSLNFQDTSESKLQTPVFCAWFQRRAGSLEGSYTTLIERGSGLAFPL